MKFLQNLKQILAFSIFIFCLLPGGAFANIDFFSNQKTESLSLPSSELTLPSLGDARLSEKEDKALSLGIAEQFELGVLQQSQKTSRALFGAAIVGIAGAAIVIAGNIYALSSKQFQFSWGMAGIVVGGLSSVAILLVTIDGSTMDRALSMGLMIIPVALIGVGITNVIQSLARRGFRRGRHRRPYRRYRRPYRKYNVVPWITAEQNYGTRGGLAVVGAF